ncbi:MAG: zinc-binding dehydrogenase [Christensenellales bacterium]
MSKIARAAVLKGPGQMEIQEFPIPQPAQGAAVGRMISSGICGTDKHSYKGETKQNAGTAAETDVAFPLIQGHENVLVIEEISEEGSRFLDFHGDVLKPGDRVTMCPDVVCGTCHYCTHFAYYPWCERPHFCYGNTRSCTDAPHLFGGFSEYIYIEPKTRLYKVPEELSDDMAVLTELMCVTYTLDKAKEFNSFSGEGFSFNDTVVIQGVGPLGLAHIIKARMLGAGKIIATDISDYKLQLAKDFGADVVINSAHTTPEQRIELVLQETRGLGADIVVECVGKPFVVPEGLAMLRKAGMYLEPGNYVDCGGTDINMHIICSKNLRIIGMCNHAYTGYRPSMEMMLRHKDNFPWAKFISHKFPLDQTEQGLITSMSDESMKVVIMPNGVK